MRHGQRAVERAEQSCSSLAIESNDDKIGTGGMFGDGLDDWPALDHTLAARIALIGQVTQ